MKKRIKLGKDPDIFLPLLTALIPVSKSKAAKRLVTSAMVASTAWKMISEHRRDSTYNVTVTSKDALYDEIHAWVLAKLPPSEQRSLTARSTRDADLVCVPESGPIKEKIKLHYNGSRSHVVDISGNPVSITVSTPEVLMSFGGSNTRTPGSQQELTFSSKNAAGRDAVIKLLDELLVKKLSSEKVPTFHLANQWNDFSSRSDLPHRPLESVVLKAGQMEGLMEDLTSFYANESKYLKLGVPYHRGYLLYGPPGVGKTSVAQALASHFKLDIYYVSLSDLKEDSSLLNMISNVRGRSILLLEDIDVMHAATSREDDPFGISMSGLLNALDGVSTPHGLVTMMTTNHIDRLDPALIRPGRIDRQEYIGYVDDEQFQRLFSSFYGVNAFLPAVDGRELTPADVVEVFKRNFDDHETALVDLKEFLQTAFTLDQLPINTGSYI